MRIWLFLFFITVSVTSFGQVKGYPDGVEAVTYLSAADQTKQPALFWAPESGNGKSVPLLVALHTWSNDFKQAGGEAVYAKWCQQVGWAFVHPNFRGPNTSPDAMGSDLAVADIVSAVEFAKSKAKIDPERIYCIGVSGGGHMAMMMAGRAPDLWAGVSAWCGISDIAAWHQQCRENKRFEKYARHIEKVLGPELDELGAWKADAAGRSPITWLAKARAVNLDMNHGVNDGRDGSVPFTHSFAAWNSVVPQSEIIPLKEYGKFYETQRFPGEPASEDLLYGTRQPRFRKISENTRLTIFEGGHEIVHEAALNWLAAQRKGRPAVWDVKEVVKIKASDKDSESGR